MAASLIRTFAEPRFRRLVWLVVGVTGWTGVAALGLVLLSQRPPQAGFDLVLILDAGRRVASGASPYLAGAVGAGTQVESLFYSYPPPIAQLASLIGGLPVGTVLTVTAVGAVAGFGLVVGGLARVAAGPAPGVGGASVVAAPRRWEVVDAVLPALAVAPYVYPFAIALLFGNVDAWFPLAYGATLLATLGGSPRWRVAGGVAIGLAAVAKLYPGVLIGWLALRGLRARIREDDPGLPGDWLTLAAAVVVGVVVVGVSLLAGGLDPWRDYVGVLRAGAGADLVSTLNVGPASQLALLLGDPTVAARVAPFAALGALLVAAVAAWAVRSPATSMALAATASLVLSPITWFHYPVALLPFAAWAWIAVRDGADPRLHRTVIALLGGAIVVAGAAIAAPVAVWLAVGLALAAVARAEARTSARGSVGP